MNALQKHFIDLTSIYKTKTNNSHSINIARNDLKLQK